MENGSAILKNPEVRQFFEEILGEEGLKIRRVHRRRDFRRTGYKTQRSTEDTLQAL
jgi:hypothetical protein